MKERNIKIISVISAILFILTGASSLKNIFDKIMLNSVILPADIICYIFWAATGISAIIAAVLLFKNKKSKLMLLFPAVMTAACGVDLCEYILSACGVESSFFYPLFCETDSIASILSYIIPEVIGFTAYIILLVYVFRNCGSDRKKAAQINKLWLLPGLMIIADYLLRKIMLSVLAGIDGGISFAIRVFTGGGFLELIVIADILIRVFAIITLCLWLKHKNEKELEMKAEEITE